MMAHRWILALLLLMSTVVADDLDEIAVAALLEAQVKSTGVLQCTRENVDSLVNIERRSFHLQFPDALIRRDTIVLTLGVATYDMPDDVLDLFGVVPITNCIGLDHRKDTLIPILYLLYPIPIDSLYEISFAVKKGERDKKDAMKKYVAYDAGEMLLYPIPRLPDTLIYSYRAIQGYLGTDSTFDINQVFYGRFVTAVANRIRSKLGLAVITR